MLDPYLQLPIYLRSYSYSFNKIEFQQRLALFSIFNEQPDIMHTLSL